VRHLFGLRCVLRRTSVFASRGRSREHAAAVAASGSIPAGNTPEVKDWTTRKTRQSKCGRPLFAQALHARHAYALFCVCIRSEIKLTSGKGLADLTVPLSTIIDNVVKQNKASFRPCRSMLAWRAADAHGARAAPLTLPPLAQVVAFIKGTRVAPECGFSKRMILNLEECGVDYEVVNVLDNTFNPGLREEIKTYSQVRGCPQWILHWFRALRWWLAHTCAGLLVLTRYPFLCPQWPTIPQLYAHGQFLGGADITGDMHDRGELKKVLAKVA